MVGNGFTMGLTAYVQKVLKRDVSLRTMMPPPPFAYWVPDPEHGDHLASEPLWSDKRFPLLVSLYDDVQKRVHQDEVFREICRRTRDLGPAFTLNEKTNAITFRGNHLGVQLRIYLWHLFASHDRVLFDSIKLARMLTWPWINVLAFLVSSTELSAISYNYDCQLEAFLGDLKFPRYTDPSACVEAYRQPARDQIPLFKPHGCISYVSFSGFRNSGNPSGSSWKECQSTPFLRREYPPRHCPVLPDIVPPGHDHLHYANYETDVADAMRLALSECEVLVVCGLSAADPDTQEIASYLEHVRPTTLAIHCGIRNAHTNDDRNNMAELLRRTHASYRFCSAEDVPFIQNWIAERARSLHYPVRAGVVTC